jgi:hypothetical protein
VRITERQMGKCHSVRALLVVMEKIQIIFSIVVTIRRYSFRLLDDFFFILSTTRNRGERYHVLLCVSAVFPTICESIQFNPSGVYLQQLTSILME